MNAGLEGRPSEAGNDTRRSIVVGVAGGSASGKSSVVEELAQILQPVASVILKHDSYYHDLSHLSIDERSEVNVDHPDSLETPMFVEDLIALREGRSVQVPDYDFVTQTRAPSGITVGPAPVILVEGLFVLAEEPILRACDLTVFISTKEAERVERRVRRDTQERGRAEREVINQHARRVQPMHDLFVEPSRRHADVILAGGAHNRDGLERLKARILRLMEKANPRASGTR